MIKLIAVWNPLLIEDAIFPTVFFMAESILLNTVETVLLIPFTIPLMVDFMPFQYQLSPTLPVRKDGPSNAIIVILSSVIGGMLACGYILLRHAMEARKMSVIE